MINDPLKKSDIARKFRDKYGAKMPTMKLARIMYSKNKLLFKNVENARKVLRYIEGKNGDYNRRSVAKDEKKYVMVGSRGYNPYKLPETDAKDLVPFNIKGEHKRALLIGDVHLPYHSVDAVTVCFDYARKEKPDLIILGGDIIDCHRLSKFVRDPKARKFSEELKQLEQFVEAIKKAFNCRIVYKLGNHEIRYDHFLSEKAEELAGIDEFELVNIIRKRAKDVDIIQDKRLIMLNELPVLHGHEFGRGFFNPVNAARGLQLRAKVSAIQFDVHKTSEHTETDLHGVIKTTWSVGCLCGLKPDYLPYNSWNHGFAICDLDSNGVDYDIRNKRIYKYRVL